MTNQPEAQPFTVVTYRQDDAGNIYRLRETVTESYHTEDSGYVPQRTLTATESFVYSTDPDAVTAEQWVNEAGSFYG